MLLGFERVLWVFGVVLWFPALGGGFGVFFVTLRVMIWVGWFRCLGLFAWFRRCWCLLGFWFCLSLGCYNGFGFLCSFGIGI